MLIHVGMCEAVSCDCLYLFFYCSIIWGLLCFESHELYPVCLFCLGCNEDYFFFLFKFVVPVLNYLCVVSVVTFFWPQPSAKWDTPV